jgi:hypothetical protein
MAKQIQAFQQSSSWRMTLPFRIGARFVRNPAATSRLITIRALSLIIDLFEKPLVKVIGLVLRNPLLAVTLKQQLLRWPNLNGHLRAIVGRNDRKLTNRSEAKNLVQTLPAPAHAHAHADERENSRK